MATKAQDRPSNDGTLEQRLQRLLVEKGIRQITLMNDGGFSIVRIGYAERGFGATLSEAYANCTGEINDKNR